jgi:Tol biopolymer transport system component
MAERGYVRISRILRHEITENVPVILYASHTDFQQTNITPGLIPEGVGGITEYQKRRVFLPFTGSYGEFDHVLTHELVHAFQTDILYGQGTEANPFAFQPPLWFMEGMAEYLSLGGVDPHTEMWLRWSTLEGFFIPLYAMDQVFDIRVYRIGQAIFDFIGDRYGDEKIGELLRMTGYYRSVDVAFEKTLGIDRRALSDEWEDFVKRKYYPQITELDRPEKDARRISKRSNSGQIHLAPSLSPDGNLLAYIEDAQFSTDIMLASGIDGKVLGRLVEGERSADFESLRYFYTSLGWSPDGRMIAFPSKRGGEDVLNILDVEERKVVRTLSFHLDGLVSPSYHPNGTHIVFSGVEGGESDLYLLDLASGNVEKLTVGPHFERDPQWSPDGKRIAFVTDRGLDTDLENLVFGESKVAILDVETKEIQLMPGQEGKNISPQWSPDGNALAFVSDRDGISNLYIQDLQTERLYRLTRLMTGVTGIIETSPPFSWSRNGRRIVYTTFQGAGWDLYQIEDPLDVMMEVERPEPLDKIASREVAMLSVSQSELPPEDPPLVSPASSSADTSRFHALVRETALTGGALTIAGPTPVTFAEQKRFQIVEDDSAAVRPIDLAEVRAETVRLLPDLSTLSPKPYKLKWAPDFLAAAPAFASNVGFAGQAVISFSDILNNHIVQFGASVYGSLSDSDLLLSYYNLESRKNWGVSLYQYRNDFGIYTAPDRASFESQIYRGIEGTISRPFSKFSRLEVLLRGVAVSEEVFEQSFVNDGSITTEQLESGMIYYGEPGVALVIDQVAYGFEGPRAGRRGRLSVDQSFGDIQSTTAIGDYRHYLPILRGAVFATRFIGGISGGKNPRLFRIGGAQTLRGVDYGRFEGDHLALMNLEMRFPLVSTLRLGWPLHVGLGGIGGVLFLDVGSAWTHAARVFRNNALDDFAAGYGFGLRLGLGYFSLKYDVGQLTNFKRRIGHAESYFTIGLDF